MAAICYTVAVSFPDDETAERWLKWMRAGHAAEVLTGGATAAEIVRMDGPVIEYEVHYRFPSRDAFDRYEREHAPRLRKEGLRQFPTEHGIHYHRATGVVMDEYPHV
jgi:Domain of unknown function (DUF4286)